MAIFKRKRDSETDAEAPETPETPEAAEPADAVTGDPAASVGISVSTFGGFGAGSGTVTSTAPPPAPETPTNPWQPGPELPPPATETIPGLRDNALLADALAALSEKPDNTELAAVARAVLQGHLFLRAKGDARALLSEGKQLPLAVANINDKQYVLAYSGGAAIRASILADGDSETSAVGQPTMAVIRHALAGDYAGIILDPASGSARAVLARALLERLVADADPRLEIKTLLSTERTPETAAKIAEALTRSKFWIGIGTAPDGKPGVAEARTGDGARLLQLFSHPFEAIALGRGDRPAPLTPEQLAATLRNDPALAGVVIDAAGPWIRLTREDLAPVLALAPPSDGA